jgi:hypothetical protein
MPERNTGAYLFKGGLVKGGLAFCNGVGNDTDVSCQCFSIFPLFVVQAQHGVMLNLFVG